MAQEKFDDFPAVVAVQDQVYTKELRTIKGQLFLKRQHPLYGQSKH